MFGEFVIDIILILFFFSPDQNLKITNLSRNGFLDHWLLEQYCKFIWQKVSDSSQFKRWQFCNWSRLTN